MKSVSVVIPTLNSAKYVAGLHGMLEKQSVQPIDVVVVDSDSDDDSVDEWRSRGARVVSIERSGFDHGGARNTGAAVANGEILAFLTQDVLPLEANWLEELVRPIQDGVASLTYGRQIAGPEAGAIERFSRAFNYPSQDYSWAESDITAMGFRGFFASNACLAVERSAFEAVDGFPSPVILSEDWILVSRLLRQGLQMYYSSKAHVQHTHNYSLGQQFARSFDQGVVVEVHREEFRGLKPGGEGVKYLRSLLTWLRREGEAGVMPYAIVESAVRFFAFELGRKHRRLPIEFVKLASMSKSYWNTVCLATSASGRGLRPS